MAQGSFEHLPVGVLGQFRQEHIALGTPEAGTGQSARYFAAVAKTQEGWNALHLLNLHNRSVGISPIHRQKAQRRKEFLGKLPYADYKRVLQVSSAHLYLSYPFVLSGSCLEAMASGCRLVACTPAPFAPTPSPP